VVLFWILWVGMVFTFGVRVWERLNPDHDPDVVAWVEERKKRKVVSFDEVKPMSPVGRVIR
jgi:hypothetical protein